MERLIAALTKLRDEVGCLPLVKNSRVYLFEQVLLKLYDIGRSGQQPTKEEYSKVAPLIKDIVPLLEHGTFILGNHFDHDQGRPYLVYRSGIEFLFDIFDSFPVSDVEELGESLKFIKESESLQSLDEEIERWKYDPITGIETIVYSEEELTRPVGVPDTHIWWEWD